MTDTANSGDGAKKLTLHEACAAGDVQAVQRLLDSGADVNAHGEERHWYTGWETPLSWAAEGGHVEVVRLLLARGANLSDSRAVCAAAGGGHGAEVLRLLIGNGGDVNEKGQGGRTPLHYAAAAGDLDTCKILLEAGAKPDTRDNAFDIGRTPLWDAAASGNVDVAKLLTSCGLDPHDTDGIQSTPLCEAKTNKMRRFLAGSSYRPSIVIRCCDYYGSSKKRQDDYAIAYLVSNFMRGHGLDACIHSGREENEGEDSYLIRQHNEVDSCSAMVVVVSSDLKENDFFPYSWAGFTGKVFVYLISGEKMPFEIRGCAGIIRHDEPDGMERLAELIKHAVDE